MTDQSERKYGRLLHSDYEPEEASRRKGAFIAAVAVLVVSAVLFPIAAYFAYLTGLFSFLGFTAILLALVLLSARFAISEKRSMRARILLYEKALVLAEGDAVTERLRYDIADLVAFFVNPKLDYIGLVLAHKGQRYLQWLDRRYLYNEPHFLETLKGLGVAWELNQSTDTIKRLVFDHNDRVKNN